jgi:hypothetical protein
MDVARISDVLVLACCLDYLKSLTDIRELSLLDDRTALSWA